MAECLLLKSGGAYGSDDCTASKAQVLQGYTAITSDSDDEPVNGTIASKSAATYYATTSDQTIAANQYLSGAQTIKGLTQTNLSGANIKPGVTIKINNGNADVWSVPSTMTNKGAATYYATTSDQTIASGQYLSGAQTIKKLTQTNLQAANIKKGVTITINNGSSNVWSVAGTWEGYVATANQPFNRGTWGSGWSIVGQKPRQSNYSQSVTITYPGSSIHLVPANASSQGYPGGALVYLKSVTMNGKNTINISVSGNIGTYSASGYYYVVLGIWNSIPSTQFNVDAATLYTKTSATIVPTSETTLSINVASITTDQYIAFGAWAMSSAQGYLDITRIWFT